MIEELATTILRGVQSGSIYAIVAVGLNLQFGATHVFNFAHGQSVMMGSVVGVVVWSSGVPIPFAFLIAVLAGGALGATTDLVAVRPMRRPGSITTIVSTLGLSTIVTALATAALLLGRSTSDTRPFPSFLPWQDTYRIGDVVITPQRILPIVVLGLLVFGLRWFLGRTYAGRLLGALADDREAALMRGLPVVALTAGAFALGGAIAALGGFVAGPVTQASASAGLSLTIKAFVAAVVGGMPGLGAAAVGGIVLGLIEQFSATYLDTSLQSAVVLVALVVLLYVKPQGLLGKSVRVV